MKGNCGFLHSKDEKPSQGEMIVTQSEACTLHQTPKPEPLLWPVWPPASACQRNTQSFSCGLADLIEDWNLLSSQDGEDGAAGQTLTLVDLNPAGSDSLSPLVGPRSNALLAGPRPLVSGTYSLADNKH